MLELTISYKERIFEVLESMPKEPAVFLAYPYLFIIPQSKILRYTYSIKDDSEFLWIEKELCRGLDPHAELKRVHKEGAVFELWVNDHWYVICPTIAPAFDRGDKYRIRGGINIEQWGMHKEAIKAWWRGEPIEFERGGNPCRSEVALTPLGYGPKWCLVTEYKVSLKPCPFCGGKAFRSRATFGSKRPFVTCTKCASKTPNAKNCVSIWNRRA